MVFYPDSFGTVGSLPPPLAVSNNQPAYFAQTDLLAGVFPSAATPDFFNMLLAELINTVEGAGLTPSKTNRAQLLSSIQTLISNAVTPPINQLSAIATNIGGPYQPNNSTQILTSVAQIARRVWRGNYTLLGSGSYNLFPDNAGAVGVDASGGNVTLTLPAAATLQSEYGCALGFSIFRLDTSQNAVTIVTQSGDCLADQLALTSTNLITGECLDLVSAPALNTWYAYRHGACQKTYFGAPGNFSNYFVRVGVRKVRITAVGGGGGGGCTTNVVNGAGGGSGAMIIQIIPVFENENLQGAVGAGGVGAATQGTDGAYGGGSGVFGCSTAGGGAGGKGGNAATQNAGGAGGGFTQFGDASNLIMFAGNYGGDGGQSLNSGTGFGGSGPFLSGGRPSAGGTGQQSSHVGAGGSGSYGGTGVGNNAGDGLVIIEEWQ